MIIPTPDILQFFRLWFLVCFLVGMPFFGYSVYRAVIAYRKRPTIRAEDIIYQEWTASGFSEASLMTRMGGARNCLRLVVTHDTLIVTTWGPFLLVSAQYDLEHVIPLANLQSVEVKNGLFNKCLRLTFRDDEGFISKICIMPSDQAAFLKAVGEPGSVAV